MAEETVTHPQFRLIELNPPHSHEEAATPASAIVLVLVACLAFSFLDACAKYLVTQGMSPQFVAWLRFIVHAAAVVVMFRGWSNREMFRVSSPLGQVMRAVFLFGSTLFNFMALRSLQLAETISIAFVAPMVITALAVPLLGERVGWRRWLAVLVGFMGVLVITRPGLGVFGIGHAWALASMSCYCFYVIMTRKMGATESTESMVFYSALGPALLLLPVVPVYGMLPQDAWQLAMMLALGLFGGFGHWLIIRAYKQATTSALAPYPYSQMVWMVALGWLVFGDLPDLWTLVGAGIIVASGLYILHRERRLRASVSGGPPKNL